MDEIQTEYKGNKLKYDEYNEEWVAKIDESEIRDRSLTKLKEYIDNLEKKNFKRVPVLINKGYSSGLKKGEITSVDEKGDFWVTDENKRREKFYDTTTEILLDNENNQSLLAEINILKGRAKQIDEEINKVKDGFERFKG